MQIFWIRCFILDIYKNNYWIYQNTESTQGF